MDRIIKFRAKRIDMNRWVYGDYFKTPLTDENSGTESTAGWFFLTGKQRHCIGDNCSAFIIDIKTLGQFTGLKDKNGKEIYEGDIVTLMPLIDDPESMRGIVKWMPELATFEIECQDESGIYTCTVYSKQVDGRNTNREIIGNIYDNPKLVKL